MILDEGKEEDWSRAKIWQFVANNSNSIRNLDSTTQPIRGKTERILEPNREGNEEALPERKKRI